MPTFGFIFTSLLSLSFNHVHITNAQILIESLCPVDMYTNLENNEIKQPWFHYISNSTDYDAEWPAIPTDHIEAYQAFSHYLASTVNFPDITDIRSLYNSLNSAQLSFIKDSVNDGTVDDGKPIGCDDACWKTVKDTEYGHIIMLADLAVFQDDVKDFLEECKTEYVNTIDPITKKLSIEPDELVLHVEGTGPNFWTIGNSIINAFAALIPVFNPLTWIVTSISSIGTSIIASSQPGATYHFIINLNNELHDSSADLIIKVGTEFSTAVTLLLQDGLNIARNYGKIKAFYYCSGKKNTDIANADTSFAILLDNAKNAAKNAFAIQVYQALLPAKYAFWGEFQCTSGNRRKCTCRTNPPPTPPCHYEEAAVWARSSTVKAIYHGNIFGWIGASGSNDPSWVIGEAAVADLNNYLLAVTSDPTYNLQYIINRIPNTATTPQSLADSVIHVSMAPAWPAIAFTLKTKMLGTYCGTHCRKPNEELGSTTNTCLYPALVCGLCDHCSIECGGGCGSCLSASTKVLMADNKWKSIDTIEVGDMVMNPLGSDGQQVLHISHPLRNRRTLYQVNNANASFTSTHPFVQYPPEEATITAVDPDLLSFYIPTMEKYKLKEMNLSADLSKYSSGSIEQLSITSIEADVFDETMDEDGEFLYDLILNPEKPSMYVIDEGIIVYNEWYDFSQYPKTTEILFGMLVDLVTSTNHTLYDLSVNKEKDRDLINNISSAMSDHTLLFYNIINDHMESEIVTDDVSECTNDTTNTWNATDWVHTLFLDDFWAVGKAFEEFIARISPHLNYVFYSDEYEYSDKICYDEIEIDSLVSKLVDGIDTAMIPMEYFLDDHEISVSMATTETIEILETQTTNDDYTDDSIHFNMKMMKYPFIFILTLYIM